MIHITCAACGWEHDVVSALAGWTIICKECGNRIPLPPSGRSVGNTDTGMQAKQDRVEPRETHSSLDPEYPDDPDSSSFFPRQQHYHFAYTVLPSVLSSGRAASMVLAEYPDSAMLVFRRTWQAMAAQLPPSECLSADELAVTAYRLGGKHLVLVIKMPPPQRSVETYFVALVFTPALRCFTLGRPPSLDGEWDHLLERWPTTLREVFPGGGGSRNLFFSPPPNVKAFLKDLCRILDVPVRIDNVTNQEVRAFAAHVPSCEPSAFDVLSSEGNKRWWEFWKQ